MHTHTHTHPNPHTRDGQKHARTRTSATDVLSLTAADLVGAILAVLVAITLPGAGDARRVVGAGDVVLVTVVR